MMRRATRRTIRTTIFLCLTVFSACCVMLPAQQINSVDDVGVDETVVVGRIELYPPLQEGEQYLVKSSSTLNAKSMKNLFFLIAGDHLEDLKDRTSKGGYTSDYFKNTAATYFQKDFYLKADNHRPLYISGGFFYTAYTPERHEIMYLPGGVRVDIKPSDKAVYIGTIEYHRDEFFNLSKIVVRNDYGRANSEFKKKLGTKFKLVERLAHTISEYSVR